MGNLEYTKQLLSDAWDAPDLGSALGAIRAAWETLDAGPILNDKVLLVTGYLEDLVAMYDELSGDDSLPLWDELTKAQQEAALDAVVNLHMNVDEYHAMIDAIEGAA